MYAIIRSGGKQYRVEAEATVTVDRMPGEAGDKIVIDDVLFVGGDKPQWGAPTIQGASVAATIVEQAKGKKIDGFTYKAKKNIHRHWGHRQQLTRIKIDAITA